jgi:hypothetical protein
MAKIRLNNDKRGVLHGLAARVVKATPIDPSTEARVNKAEKVYDSTFAALASATVKAVVKTQNAKEMVVLKKHRFLADCHQIWGVNLDTQEVIQVNLFNATAYQRIHPINHLHDYNERHVRQRDENTARDKTEISVIQGGKGSYQSPLPLNAKTLRLTGELKRATEELNIAITLDAEKRSTILNDFTALIECSKTFEDVVAIWPEAAEVTDEIMGHSQQVALMSSDAVERIKANMAIRNKP